MPEVGIEYSQRPKGLRSLIKKNIKVVLNMRKSIFRILVLFFFSNAAQAPWIYNFTTYMGQDLYHGDPQSVSETEAGGLYDQGVRMGSLGIGAASLVGLAFASATPYLAKGIGTENLYVFVFTTASIPPFLALLPVMNSPSIIILLYSLLGFISAFQVPYALMGAVAPKKHTQLFMGLMNLANVLGHLVGNSLAGIAMYYYDYVGAGMVIGGIFSVIGVLAAIWILIANRNQDVNELEDNTVVNTESPLLINKR